MKCPDAVLFGVLGFLVQATLPCAGIVNEHVTFCGDPRAEVAISWYSETGIPDLVSYGLNPSNLTPCTQIESVTNFGGFEHHAHLTNLVAGRRYCYTIAGNGTVITGTFRTAPDGPAPFRFAVLGDVQTKGDLNAIWRDVGRWIASQDVAFVVTIGDMVDVGGSQAYWNAFFQTTPELFRSTVFMPIIGNHETYGNGLQPYFNQFRLPGNGPVAIAPDGLPCAGRWYSFVYGNTHVVTLDNVSINDDATMLTQSMWLVSQTPQLYKWKFAFLHMSVFTSGLDCNPYSQDLWGPQYFDPRDVDVVFNGHSHMLEYTCPIRRLPLHGTDGGTGFAGPWQALFKLDTQSPFSNMFFIETSAPIRYPGYDVGDTAVKTFAHGSFYWYAQIAQRPLAPVTVTSTLWLSYFYKKNKPYYYAKDTGGFRLVDSTQPNRYLQAATSIRAISGTNYAAFQVGLGSATADTAPLGPNPLPDYTDRFVLAKFTFSSTQACAYLKVFRSPDPIATNEPIEWDAIVRTNLAWSLRLDTLRLLGEYRPYDSWIAALRIGTALGDVLPPVTGSGAKTQAMIEEPFAVPQSRKGVVHIDAGGVCFNTAPPGNRYTVFRQLTNYVPYATIVQVDQDVLKIETHFCRDFGTNLMGDVWYATQVVPEPAGVVALGAAVTGWWIRRRS